MNCPHCGNKIEKEIIMTAAEFRNTFNVGDRIWVTLPNVTPSRRKATITAIGIGRFLYMADTPFERGERVTKMETAVGWDRVDDGCDN